MIEYNIVTKAIAKVFGEMCLEETPNFVKYEYASVERTPDETLEELEQTPDLSTNFYLNTSIVLPQGHRLS